MSSDLDELTTRLKTCVRVMTGVVPDDPPPWASLPLAGEPSKRLRRGALLCAAAVAALVVAVSLVWVTGQRTERLDAQLIAATSHTIDAGTARIRLTAAPIGGQPSTASGVVNFAVPSAMFRYPSGYSVILIGDRVWDTGFPITTLPNGALAWVREPLPSQASKVDAQLALALQPDSAPAALLSALRSATKRVRYLGSQKVNGQVSRHYRAIISPQWQADVWVASGELVRVVVRTSSGTSSVNYFDFGVKVLIRPPSDAEAQARSGA